MPVSKEDGKLNVTANEFNESATSSAVINVSMQAENATALQFASDSRVVATDSQATVTVQAADEFGNLNTSATPDITLESSDTSVITINDAKNQTTTATNGESSFTVKANASSGSATLTATATNYTNVSDEWSVGTPANIEVTFGSDITTSNKQGATSTTTMYAQLQDGEGTDLSIRFVVDHDHRVRRVDRDLPG
jgi:hypothetical protein